MSAIDIMSKRAKTEAEQIEVMVSGISPRPNEHNIKVEKEQEPWYSRLSQSTKEIQEDEKLLDGGQKARSASMGHNTWGSESDP